MPITLFTVDFHPRTHQWSPNTGEPTYNLRFPPQYFKRINQHRNIHLFSGQFQIPWRTVRKDNVAWRFITGFSGFYLVKAVHVMYLHVREQYSWYFLPPRTGDQTIVSHQQFLLCRQHTVDYLHNVHDFSLFASRSYSVLKWDSCWLPECLVAEVRRAVGFDDNEDEQRQHHCV